MHEPQLSLEEWIRYFDLETVVQELKDGEIPLWLATGKVVSLKGRYINMGGDFIWALNSIIDYIDWIQDSIQAQNEYLRRLQVEVSEYEIELTWNHRRLLSEDELSRIQTFIQQQIDFNLGEMRAQVLEAEAIDAELESEEEDLNRARDRLTKRNEDLVDYINEHDY